jgi:hypothetical protein
MWDVDKIPTGPGLVKRHGVLDVNWTAPTAPGAGELIPVGGLEGQVLAKASALDGDVEWVDSTGGGGPTVASWAAVGTLAVRTGPSRWVVPVNAVIVSAYAAVGTAPTGAAIVIDVNLNGTTIFTTQANRPTIAAGTNYSGLVTNMNVTAVTAGQYLTVDIDSVGSTVAGGDLSVFVQYEPI